MCLSAGPQRDPSTGQPAIQVNTCNSSDKSQLWRLSNGEIINEGKRFNISSNLSDACTLAGSNLCLDVTSHEDELGGPLETYACNGGSNQKWIFNSATHELVDQENIDFVVTVCAFPS